MSKQADIVYELAKQLEALSLEVAEMPTCRIDYRERVRIERPLFLILKEICHRNLAYELHGLTEVHRSALYEHLASKNCSRQIQDFARRIFEFRLFLQSLSSANSYVQGDALSRVSLTRQGSTDFVVRQLKVVANQALEIISGQNCSDAN